MHLSGILRRVLSRWMGVRRMNKPKQQIEGLPEGVEFERLNDICLDHFGKPLKTVSYSHVSGWKASGAYRLYLVLGNRRERRVVFKNALYDEEQIPSLVGLPVHPGPPEYTFYSNPAGPLAGYLPEIYLAEELVPGRHYHYLLEDLDVDYQPPYSLENFLYLVKRLSILHCELENWQSGIGQDDFLHYDQAYSSALQTYAQEKLEGYAQVAAGEPLRSVLQLWSKIVAIHGREEYRQLQPVNLLHGDFNGSNIFVHRRHPEKIKLIDWEWAGVGLPHADLASLFKGGDPELEQQVLQIFASHNNVLSLEQHKRLYSWSQLERALLDASFLAAYSVNSSQVTKLDIPEFIDFSLREILRRYAELAGR